ncbi:DUF3857 domain-containing protein [Parapedobacter koreensis]|uniref:DUF3857 domain-containing protein n=1 Tax=Parapedobacter koreensis TaxID=332977 RepID=A0A1H7MLA2_9SPHI|nr:DUF3857 domain-containing protein [Parapedobacter koreensis]SEL11407.1 protein of unknown function [Parapedobacter koreensis]
MRVAIMLMMLWMVIRDGYAQQGYAVSAIPAMLKSRADAVVRQETIVADMLAATKVRYQVKQAVTVFNRSGENKARLVIYYDKNVAIKRIAGKVFDADGLQVGKFTQRDFTDESAVSSFSLYEDTRVKHFLPAMTSYPYTVEYEYELELKQNLIIPAWRPDAYRDVAVVHSQYTFICDPADDVRVKATNYKGDPEVSNADGRKALTWTAIHIPAQRYEPFSPDPETYQTMVKVAPVNFSYYKHNGHYSDWGELGKWTYDALLADGLELPERTVQEVKQLVTGLASDKEKAKVLYTYMQRKTRYISVQIGIGGFKPMAASDVDRLGYGDCKGLVNYMQALLNVAGIPSYYCVVEAGATKRDLQPDFAGMEQGNHVILCLPFERDTTWLECTDQRIPFGFLGSFTDDRTVWACTPEGGLLLRTPHYAVTASTQRRTAELALDVKGTVSGRVETVFTAGQYDNHLEIAESNGSEQVKLLKDAYDIDQISFSQLKYQKRDEAVPTLVEAFQVALAAYVPENNGQVFLIPNAFNRRSTIPAVKNRVLPLYINRGYTDEDSISYALPEGYHLSQPVEEEIDSAFGYYYSVIKQEGNKISYYRKFTLNEGTFPAEQYADFCSFINRVSSLDNYKAVLAKR